MEDTTTRRRAAGRQQRFLPEYSFVRLSVSTQIPADKSKSFAQQKSPTRHPGAFGDASSREKR
jgi:hypothetical protein